MTHNDEEEKSFVDTYRSEILNKGQEKEESPLPKIISTFLFIIAVSGVSIFGYNYFSKNKSDTNIREHEKEKRKEVKEIEKDALPISTFVEIEHVEDLEKMESPKIESIAIPTATLIPEATFTPTPTSTKNDIEQIANQMKLEIAKELDKKNSSAPTDIDPTPIAPPTQKGEALYMQQLKDLSEEIDREAI